MTPQPSRRSRRHRLLEKQFPESLQLSDETGGLDEFAPETERSLLRIGPPDASLTLNTIPDRTVVFAAESDGPRFAGTGHTGRMAIVGSVLLAAMAAVLWLQPSTTRPVPAGDISTPPIGSSPARATADSPPFSPSADSAAPTELPVVDVPSPATAPDADDRPLPRVVSPSASVPALATTSVPPPAVVALDAPVAAPVIAAESTVAAIGASSVPAAATPASDAATATAAPTVLPSPSETPRSTSTDAPMNAVPRPTARELDTRAIENVLSRYRTAFNRLDAGAAAAVWPTVNQRNLAKAFERLDDQDLSFENCKIDVGGVHAEAACNGTARYVQKVGNRNPKAESRQWRFILRRASEGWVIDHLDAR